MRLLQGIPAERLTQLLRHHDLQHGRTAAGNGLLEGFPNLVGGVDLDAVGIGIAGDVVVISVCAVFSSMYPGIFISVKDRQAIIKSVTWKPGSIMIALLVFKHNKIGAGIVIHLNKRV